MTQPKLIILSDLWGLQSCSWLQQYTNVLSDQYEIQIYDSRELAEIDTQLTEEIDIHRQFVEYGIDRAVTKLKTLEPYPENILAFSIGGTIVWKYLLDLDKSCNLICLSSTRLRYEIQKPLGDIHLFFGANDLYKPENMWFEKLSIIHKTIVPNEGHSFYRKASSGILEAIMNIFNKD